MLFRKFIHTINVLPRPAYMLLRVSLVVSCVLLLAAFLLLRYIYAQSAFDYGLYMTAAALLEQPPVLILVAHLGVVIIIDFWKQ